MHELAVTQNLLEITLRHARMARARRVTALHLVLGELASMVDDSIQFYWDIISENTPAEGATLLFRRPPAELACLDCGERRRLEGTESLTCRHCGGGRARLVAGEEFYLESIDIEKAVDEQPA